MAAPLHPPLRITARVVEGSGRGRKLETPTMNLDFRSVPSTLESGIYACKVFLFPANPERWCMGAMHYGPRPVFQDSASLEVHVLDQDIALAPDQLTVEVVAKIREVENFPGPDALKAAVAKDIAETRAILSA